MTRMIDSLAGRPPLQRVAIAFALGTIGLFLAGMTLGVVVAIATKGWPSRLWVSLIPVIAAPLSILALTAAWRMVAPPKHASAYEKKYWNVWLAIVAISAPVGAISAILMLRSGVPTTSVFTAPIAPGAAIALALMVTAACIAAIVLYHRAIDDHEERAYLWGSQLAYYFLIVAFPAWWLLERGGIVAGISTGTAFAAILISFVVQAGVWAWLKYR
jgi:hypothetical protein